MNVELTVVELLSRVIGVDVLVVKPEVLRL